MLVALSIAALVAGCAYSFSGSNLPVHIKSLAVPSFENETLEPALADEVTSGVLQAFIDDGRLRIAPEAQADSRLNVTITQYENKVYNYAADQTPRDYIVVLTVSAALRDQVKNRDIWEDESITRTAVYDPTGANAPLASEEQALDQIVRDLAADMVSRTLEQW